MKKVCQPKMEQFCAILTYLPMLMTPSFVVASGCFAGYERRIAM